MTSWATMPSLAAAAASPTMASWSNLALYSAMAVYTIAMLLFAGYLAALGPASSHEVASAEGAEGAEGGEATAAQVKELVAVGAAGADASGEAPVSAAGTPRSAGPLATSSGSDDASPRARRLAGSALSMTWLATTLLAASVIRRGLAVMRAPWGNMFEFANAGALAAAVAYLVLARRNRWQWLGIFVVGPVLLTLGLALLAFYTEAAELMPALKSVWLVIHVIVAILAVGLFTVAFALGVVYLLKARQEARAAAGTAGKRTFLETLPGSASLERAAYGLNMIGFILWTFTLVAGAIWAQKAWGSYWTWDPKEVWTFVVWVVYAAYMHARATAGWEPRKAMWIAIAGFVSIIINFAVVNVFFVGQHSYSGL